MHDAGRATINRFRSTIFPSQSFPSAVSAGGAALLFLLLALALRSPQFGNPVIQMDEQFYLLVGDRFWHGALPYVDIWDRKPVGLFLIYAAIRGLGGDGIIQYQCVATLFAVATALVIRGIALRIATPFGALGAGLVYIAALGLFGGDGGQSPVFYNLFVALAALATIGAVERGMTGRAAHVRAAMAMILMGLAIQIKYTSLFEGAFFGLALAWASWRAGVSFRLVLLYALGWIVLGLAPTLAAWAAYAAAGYSDAFVYNNFTSVFMRHDDPVGEVVKRVWKSTLRILPLAVAAAIGLSRPRDSDAIDASPLLVVRGWLIAAVLGFIVFGTYFDHYVLPLLVPLAVGAARLLGPLGPAPRGRAWRAAIFGFLLVFFSGFTLSTIAKNQRDRGNGEQVRQMSALIRKHLTGCIYVYDGEPILYHLTNSCLPTRWPFPDHLSNLREDDSIGVDALTETRRIMADRPGIVVTSAAPKLVFHPRTWNFMQSILERDYRRIGMWQIGRRTRVIYERRDAIGERPVRKRDRAAD